MSSELSDSFAVIIHCLNAEFQWCLSWQCISNIPLLVTIQRLDWCIILPVSLFNYCSIASSGAFISSSGRGGALGMRGEVGRCGGGGLSVAFWSTGNESRACWHVPITQLEKNTERSARSPSKHLRKSILLHCCVISYHSGQDFLL